MAIFRINDMKCGVCAARIQRSILAIDDAAKIGVNARDKTVQVSGDLSDADYMLAIQTAGYTPELLALAEAEQANAEKPQTKCCGSTSAKTSCCG